MATPTKFTDEVIGNDEVVTARRGRKAVINDKLLAQLAKVDETHGVSLGSTLGSVFDADGNIDDKKKQKVSGAIRSHWKQLHGTGNDAPKSRIDFHPATGVPQVRMR